MTFTFTSRTLVRWTRWLSLTLLVVLVHNKQQLVSAADGNDDDTTPPDFSQIPGFGDKPCPNFRCSQGFTPVQKARAKFKSTGCSTMGAGMMMMSAGGQEDDKAYAPCCDQWHACYQICGTPKMHCDNAFKLCSTEMCGTDEDCKKGADLSSMMLSMGGCQKYDQEQYQACECVEDRKVGQKRLDALKSFYRKHASDNVDKAEELAKKVDSVGKMAALFKKLLLKYPNAIKKEEDPQQAMYKRMMEEAAKEKPEGADDAGSDEATTDEGETQEL